MAQRGVKLALIGSGQIGAMVGLLAGLKRLVGRIQLFDVVPGIPEGKALDLSQMMACEGIDCQVSGSGEHGDLSDADVVVVTAGVPRKPGMSRDDLLAVNAKIIKPVAAAIKQYCSNSFVICITNPLDVMVHLLQKESGLPHNRVVGMSGELDASRFQSFLAQRLQVSVDSVNALVMGCHGEAMVPIPRFCSVAGIPLHEICEMGWLSHQELTDMIERTRHGGQEVVDLLKTGSAFFTPASAAVKMMEAYLKDQRKVIPCAAYLNGEYGAKDVYVGVPAIIGKNGVEKVIELRLDETEKGAFEKSIESVRVLQNSLSSLNIV